jgi:predicted SAM-dependent methyltransferase
VVVTITGVRLNLGAGDYRLAEYLNIDAVPGHAVDLVLTVPPLPWPDESVEAIYMGHVLEHFARDRGRELLDECFRVLAPGGTIGVVVPDFREVARRYVNAEHAPFEWFDGSHDLADLDALCHFVLFSTCQPSHHLWAYDFDTLRRALRLAGFEVLSEIDRYHDPRLSTPQWYQTGAEARKA